MYNKNFWKDKTLKIVKVNSNLIHDDNYCCGICFETDNLIKLDCKHTYHTNCLNEWIKDNNTCPLCRNVLEIKYLLFVE
jgi:hypothetical protein